jgi:hypothetical protein
MRETRNAYGTLAESLEEGYLSQDVGIVERIILKWIIGFVLSG